MDSFCRKTAFVLILAIVGRPTLGEQPITCRAPETVNEEEASSLEFRFGTDLRTTKQDFYVYRFKNDGSEPVIVTLCEYHLDTWRCDTVDGYSVTTATISDEVKLEIKSAQEAHSGQYVCKTLQAAKSPPASPCSLVVQAKPKVTCHTEGVPTIGESTSLTCNFESDLRRTEQDFYIYRFQDDNSEPAIIALCSWNGIDYEHNCETAAGYKLSPASISKKVTLVIPSATGEHSGYYICKTLPAEKSPAARQCSLIVQNTTESSASKTNLPVLIGSLVGCLIFVAAAVGLLLVLIWKKKTPLRQTTGEEKQKGRRKWRRSRETSNSCYNDALCMKYRPAQYGIAVRF